MFFDMVPRCTIDWKGVKQVNNIYGLLQHGFTTYVHVFLSGVNQDDGN